MQRFISVNFLFNSSAKMFLFVRKLATSKNVFNKYFHSTKITTNETKVNLTKNLRNLIDNDHGDGSSLAIVSLSNDIHVNLALENYLAEAVNLKKVKKYSKCNKYIFLIER